MISITNFVYPLLVPDLFEFSEQYRDMLFNQLQPSLILFLHEKDMDSEFMKTYEEAAKQNRKVIAFAYSGLESQYQKEQAKIFGVKEEELPILIGYVPRGNNVVRSPVKPAQHNERSLRDFAE